jgi:hypothetical protein
LLFNIHDRTPVNINSATSANPRLLLRSILFNYGQINIINFFCYWKWFLTWHLIYLRIINSWNTVLRPWINSLLFIRVIWINRIIFCCFVNLFEVIWQLLVELSRCCLYWSLTPGCLRCWSFYSLLVQMHVFFWENQWRHLFAACELCQVVTCWSFRILLN